MLLHLFHEILHTASRCMVALHTGHHVFAPDRPRFLRSATNYLLGLSSVPFKPFLAATFAAMAVWGPLYASIGAASRGVLKSRGDVGAIFAGEGPSLTIAALLISWIPRREQLRCQPTSIASLTKSSCPARLHNRLFRTCESHMET